MTPLEIAANVVNLLSVVLAARNHVMTWSTGILGCVLFGVLFYQQKLYADVTLQFYFTVTSVLGWYNWKFGGAEYREREVTTLGLLRFLRWSVVAAVLGLAYGWFLSCWTDASYPYFDSLILSFSILAQTLLLERLVENWLGWIVVNTIAVPIYAAKGLLLTSAIYGVFLGNAFYGVWRWRRLSAGLRER